MMGRKFTLAEFCLKCLNKISDTDYTEKEYIISDYPELCENCGKLKPVVIRKKWKIRIFLENVFRKR